jgi:hypothetical protein
VARLVILRSSPYHLTAEPVAAGAREQVGRILTRDAVRRAELTPLRCASDRHPAECPWNLELHLEPGIDGREFVETPGYPEWLDDLRSPGPQPFVMLADGETIHRADTA